MESYTLGLFANMFPAFDGDYRGIFIQQMVRDLESRGVRVKKAVKKSPSAAGYIPFYFLSLGLARDRDLDILQAEYIPHSSIIPAFFRSEDNPLVLKFHGDDARIYPFKNRFNMKLTRFMIDRAAHVITSSEEIRQILIGIGADSDRITSIHTGIDTEFFSPRSQENCRKMLGLPQESTIFLFVGRLHVWKGITEIISVAGACPDLLFIFVGDGVIPGHPKNCTFVGAKTPQKVRMWLNAADCLVLPTHTEAIPTSVMEAFACGIPAITTNIGGCTEIVEHQKNGLLIPVRDEKSLLNAILWMSNHSEERKEMGKQGRITVIDKFDHIQMTDRLINVHQKLIFKS
jgi:glycosyltransferase involved in cell wall biosynthesis